LQPVFERFSFFLNYNATATGSSAQSGQPQPAVRLQSVAFSPVPVIFSVHATGPADTTTQAQAQPWALGPSPAQHITTCHAVTPIHAVYIATFNSLPFIFCCFFFNALHIAVAFATLCRHTSPSHLPLQIAIMPAVNLCYQNLPLFLLFSCRAALVCLYGAPVTRVSRYTVMVCWHESVATLYFRYVVELQYTSPHLEPSLSSF
jgi:hypothetical protein